MKVSLNITGTVITTVCFNLKYRHPFFLDIIPEQAVFLLAVERHMTLGMTSCNINYFREQWWISDHLPRLPDGAAQKHAEDHPKHL